MFASVARLVSRYPRWVIAAWLLVVGLALPFAARVGDVLTGKPGTAPGSEAAAVAGILSERFSDRQDAAVVLVGRPAEGGARDRRFEESFAGLLDTVRGMADVASVQRPSELEGIDVPADADAEIALVFLAADDPRAELAAVREIRALFETVDGASFALAGGPATDAEIEAVSKRDARRAELFGLPLSLVVLGIAFGALVASALPLLVAAASIVVSLAIVYLLGQTIEFAVFTHSIVTMLGLATGIDYALLMVNRYREELRTGMSPRRAAETTTRTAGKAVAFSGLTVVIALGSLLIPPLEYIRSIGVGTIVVLFVSMLVSTTALPAALALLGRRVNALRLTTREPGTRSRVFWRRRANAIMRRPWAWALAGAGVLALLCLPALRMQLADPGPLGLSERTEARRTVAALAGLELEGLLNPMHVLVDYGETGFYHPSSVRALSKLVRQIERAPDVDVVISPLSAGNVPRLFLYQYYASAQLARNSEVADLARATVSRGGRYALLEVIPAGNLPPDASADLRRRVAALAQDAGLAVRIGGTDVLEAEWSRVLYRSLPLAIALVGFGTLVLLGIAFRSLLIPVKSILLNVLTVGASYGVITAVFQDGWLARLVGLEGGLGFIDTSAPLFIFAVVFGLSMDYEVFLVARIFEAHERGLSDREAVASALSATGGVITSAATIMIVVFSLFVFSEVVLIKTLGLGLAVAVLLDATIVRVALVPAVMTMAGRWNWWLPAPLASWAARLGLGHD